MECPKAALFDLDDTLAESFKPPAPEMIEKLQRLLEKMPVAILSGASFERMRSELLDQLAEGGTEASLFALPDSASAAYTFADAAWQCEYSLVLTADITERIKAAIETSVQESAILADPRYEPQILVEPTQVRYAALGLGASEADKDSWDPDRAKRRALKALLDQRLPDCEVLIGGRTTIDITHKGVDKAYGVRWLSEKLSMHASDMFYVGDALYEGGNDQVVIATGAMTRQTSGPEETLSIIDEVLAACEV